MEDPSPAIPTHSAHFALHSRTVRDHDPPSSHAAIQPAKAQSVFPTSQVLKPPVGGTLTTPEPTHTPSTPVPTSPRAPQRATTNSRTSAFSSPALFTQAAQNCPDALSHPIHTKPREFEKGYHTASQVLEAPVGGTPTLSAPTPPVCRSTQHTTTTSRTPTPSAPASPNALVHPSSSTSNSSAAPSTIPCMTEDPTLLAQLGTFWRTTPTPNASTQRSHSESQMPRPVATPPSF